MVATTTFAYPGVRYASARVGLEDLDSAALSRDISRFLRERSVAVSPGDLVELHLNYEVAPDGSLRPKSSQLNAKPTVPDAVLDTATPQGRNPLSGVDLAQSRRVGLGALRPARAALSPSEEVGLYAQEETDASPAPRTTRATAEDGSTVVVDIIAPRASLTRPAPPEEATAKKTAGVAALYARNNDVVFSALPLTRLAA